MSGIAAAARRNLSRQRDIAKSDASSAPE